MKKRKKRFYLTEFFGFVNDEKHKESSKEEIHITKRDSIYVKIVINFDHKIRL